MKAWLDRPILVWTIAIVLIALHLSLGYFSLIQKAPTTDEYTYIATGYLYCQDWDFRLDRTHPPLTRLLIGAALQPLYLWLPKLQRDKWNDPVSYTLGYQLGWEMLLRGKNDWRLVCTVARLPILLLSGGLALLIFYWTEKMYGPRGGLLSLFLYCLSPNMLAHARFATMDLSISFFFVAVLFCLHQFSVKHRLIDQLLIGIMLGCALAAKANGILLLPVTAGALIYLSCVPGTWKDFDIKQFAKTAGIVFLTAFAILLAIYGYPFRSFYYFDTLKNVFVKSLQAGGKPVPGMPHANYAFYLLGNYSTQGWWYYYPVAIAVKTPIAVFGLLFLILAFGTKRWKGFADGLIAGTIAIVLLTAMMNRVNIGLRHILHVYPLLFVYLGRVVYLRKSSVSPWIVGGFCLWLLAANLYIYPNYLTYFNEAIGGPSQGHRYLDDSNIDWGQDLNKIKEIREQYPGEDFYVATNWMYSEELVGWNTKRLSGEQIAEPPKGIVAVGKHWAIRHRISKRSPDYFDWIEKYHPIGNIGHSIWLFEFQ